MEQTKSKIMKTRNSDLIHLFFALIVVLTLFVWYVSFSWWIDAGHLVRVGQGGKTDLSALDQRVSAENALLSANSALHAYLAFGKSADLQYFQADLALIRRVCSSQITRRQESCSSESLCLFAEQWNAKLAAPLITMRSDVDRGKATQRGLEHFYSDSKPEIWDQQLRAQVTPVSVLVSSIVSKKTERLQEELGYSKFHAVLLAGTGTFSLLIASIKLYQKRGTVQQE